MSEEADSGQWQPVQGWLETLEWQLRLEVLLCTTSETEAVWPTVRLWDNRAREMQANPFSFTPLQARALASLLSEYADTAERLAEQMAEAKGEGCEKE